MSENTEYKCTEFMEMWRKFKDEQVVVGSGWTEKFEVEIRIEKFRVEGIFFENLLKERFVEFLR